MTIILKVLGGGYEGKEIIPPDKLSLIDFDKIVISSSFFQEIIEQLFELDIPADKIEILNCFGMAVNDLTTIRVRPDKSIECSIDGKVKFQCKNNIDITIARDIFGTGNYNFHTTAKSVVVMDVGMNIGLSALYFAKYNNVKKIYGFEPVQQIYKRAIENIELNTETVQNKIELYNCALGNHEETIFFKYDKDISGGMLHLNQKKNDKNKDSAVIQYMDADTIFRRILDKHVGSHIILKCDCEGGEYEIFDTLKSGGTLKKINTILLEYHDYGNLNEKVIERYLEESGFDYVRLCTKLKYGMIYAYNKNI